MRSQNGSEDDGKWPEQTYHRVPADILGASAPRPAKCYTAEATVTNLFDDLILLLECLGRSDMSCLGHMGGPATKGRGVDCGGHCDPWSMLDELESLLLDGYCIKMLARQVTA